MAIEIERTFLLTALPPLPPGATAVRIEQGYLPPADMTSSASASPDAIVEGRLHRATRADGTTCCTNTIKTGSGLTRQEDERVIDADAFDAAWPRTAGRRLVKTRHAVAEGDLEWVIDDFDGIDLVLAEVELPAEDTPAPPPPWLVPYIVREVTEEPAFRNYEIARLAFGDTIT